MNSVPASPPVSGRPTGRLVAIVVGVILAIGVLTVGGLVVVGYFFASKVNVTASRDEHGRDRTLKIETPIGRLRVDKQERVDPRLLDIPLYPGAEVMERGATARVDLDLDFADQSLRVVAVEMETGDPIDKVILFYREAAADFVFIKKSNGSVEFSWERGRLRKVVGIFEKGGTTRISLAQIGEPKAN